METSDPAAPKIVHAFLSRDAQGITINETWDVLGMRATRSDDTVLGGVVVPDAYVVRVLPAGLAGADYFLLSIFAVGSQRFQQRLYGLARRALELTVENVKARGSLR